MRTLCIFPESTDSGRRLGPRWQETRAVHFFRLWVKGLKSLSWEEQDGCSLGLSGSSLQRASDGELSLS